MKRLALVLAVLVALVMLASAVWAAENVLLDSVDIGTPNSETGHNLVGWRDLIVPDQNPGTWGGLATDPLSVDKKARVIWAPEEGNGNWATVLLHTDRGAAMTLRVRHLDGLADDSFDVLVQHANGSWVLVGHYTGLQTGTEDWLTTDFDLSTIGFGRGRDFMVKLEATGPPWSGFETWGQVCFDWIELYGNGATR